MRVMALGAAGMLAACAPGMLATMTEREPTYLYDAMTDQDVALAARTMQQALEYNRDGEAATWREDSSGHSGSIRPVSTYMTDSGTFCRDYEETLRIAGEDGTLRNLACRDGNGRWVWTDG